MRSMRRVSMWLAAALLLMMMTMTSGPVAAEEPKQAVIYFNEACGDCWIYVQQEIIPTLQEAGLTDIVPRDYINEPANRTALLKESERLGVPLALQSHLTVFIGERIILEGHIPLHVVRDLLAAPVEAFERIIVYQDRMRGITDYKVWAFAGEVRTFPVDTPLDEVLTQIERPEPGTILSLQTQREANLATLLPAVIVTGLLDSVNPCAFAVILLLLAFLFTIRQSRGQIIKLGGVYIGMIFLVYFSIGLGILRAVRISNNPHFVARAGSWLLIALGTLNIIEYFWPQVPIKLHLPAAAHKKTNELLKVASVPATAVMGLIVGLCTFPCSGGIYVSIITLINAKTTLAWGLGYLTLYNVMFVLPLIGILLAAGNRVTAKAWARWEREHALRIRLWYGIAMVALGIIMLFWVI